MPFLLAIFLLGYFALCGRGWLAGCRVNLGHARSWLVAPSLGLALNTLAVLTLNQAGLPVASFARPLAAALILISLGLVTWRRHWCFRGLAPFVLLALAALAVGAWPMLRYGYNWVSYGNDDMTNYCLAAQRALHDGFYRVPNLPELAGTDYSQFYWFMHVALLIRAGSEVLLAGVAGVLGRPPVEIFMPVIFSLALTQLWALGALLYSCPRKKRHALLAGAFLAVSPLWTYGTLHQLIAQVGGIALLLAALTFTTRHRFAPGWPGRLRQAGAISLPVAGLGVFYPEVIPFLVLSLGLYSVVQIVRQRKLISGQLSVALLSAALLGVLLRHNLISTFTTLMGQAAGGLTQEDITLTIFPYFLMPKGLSLLLGLETITTPWPEPLASLCIGAGVGSLILLTLAGLRGTLLARPASCLLVVMLAIGARLFQGNNGFGLFKLAMFITPVLLAELAGLLAAQRRLWLALGVSLLLGAGWVTVTQRYVRTATPSRNNVFLEIDDASLSRGQLPTGSAPLFSDVASSPVAKLAAGAQGGTPITFLSRPFLKGIMELVAYRPGAWVWNFMPVTDIPRRSAELRRLVSAKIFVPEKAFGTIFWPAPTPAPPVADALLTSKAEYLSFNKLFPVAMPAGGAYAQVPFARLKDHLVFVHSEAGQHYYLGQPGLIAVYKHEPDIYSATGSFFAIGRKLVFQVLNPSPSVRLRLSLTDSILGQGHTRLPAEAVVLNGQAGPVALGLVGAGSANAYSAPFQPLQLDGRAYVALDLMRAPSHLYTGELLGLNRLYNKNVRIDPRDINGYCRDISLISEEDYQHLSRPAGLFQFPQDLVEQPGLEYSGIYEDGWVSGRAFVTLGAVRPGQRIVLKGMLPLLPGGALPDNTLELRLNGRLVSTTILTPGDFTLVSPVDFAAKSVRIDLHFSHEAPLPANDQRPIAALLKSIAILPGE